jgi:hypothetical protein
VQEGGHRDAHGVEVLELQQLLPAVQPVLDAVAVHELRADVGLQAGHRHDLHAGQLVVGLQVLLPGPAHTDDADAQRAHANHPRGEFGLSGGACRSPRGAAHRTALAMTRRMSGWW